MNISLIDAKNILNWYEYATSESFHYGNAKLLFPEEQDLIYKLENMISEIEISDHEIERISDWMIKSIKRKYGSSEYLFGDEAVTYALLIKEKSRIQSLQEKERERLLLEQKRMEEEKARQEELRRKLELDREQFRIRTENAAALARATKELQEAQQNRSLEEKIAAAKKLNEEMNIAEKYIDSLKKKKRSSGE